MLRDDGIEFLFEFQDLLSLNLDIRRLTLHATERLVDHHTTMRQSRAFAFRAGHKQYGTSYQYYPLVTEKEYGRSSLTGIIRDYFNDSYMSAVSAFVKEEKISVDELRELIETIENGKS